MTRAVVCVTLVVLLIINFSNSDAATRVARSPQFGFSQANAQSSAQAFGGGPGFGYGGGPGFGYGGGPGFSYGGYRPRGFGGYRPHGGFGGFRPGFGRPGFGNGGSLSISKSISISGGGAAQSSAGSSAFGK